jgi:carboxypeptidase Taq
VNRAFEQLRRRVAEVTDLEAVVMLLEWDFEVMMPRAATTVRGEQLATAERVAHERLTDPEVGRLLDELEPAVDGLDPDTFEASLVRVVRRDFEKARRVSADLRADLARAAADGHAVWVEARERSDFTRFRPALERNLELKLRYVACFDGYDDPYDVLLDDYEPDLKTAEAAEVLDRLREELVPLVAERTGEVLDDSFLTGTFPVQQQRELERRLLPLLGYDEETWRLDDIVHPAQFGLAPTDIRISTRYSEHTLESLFSVLHEFGHGLYERQVDPALTRTPLAGGASLGLHESQSRLWENLVGRGLPFCRFLYPQLQEAFPEQLGEITLDRFYRAINKVKPSLIRVDADEVTYNLHIVLRFELERELLGGRLPLDSLPDAWNERMHRYLGVEVPDDARGVLQDSHWSGGGFGYFPTYSLGNVASVQIWQRAREALPALDDDLERGDFSGLREWLRDVLHRNGRKFTPRETMERAAGAALDPGPYLDYLREKSAEIYRLTARK